MLLYRERVSTTLKPKGYDTRAASRNIKAEIPGPSSTRLRIESKVKLPEIADYLIRVRRPPLLQFSSFVFCIIVAHLYERVFRAALVKLRTREKKKKKKKFEKFSTSPCVTGFVLKEQALTLTPGLLEREVGCASAKLVFGVTCFGRTLFERLLLDVDGQEYRKHGRHQRILTLDRTITTISP